LDDALPIIILDGYRYRNSRKLKSAIDAEIKRKLEAADREGENEIKEKQKRLKNMYLVNKVKFFSSATPEEIRRDLSADGTDEGDTRRILQHRVR
jgi:hypothetical protein